MKVFTSSCGQLPPNVDLVSIVIDLGQEYPAQQDFMDNPFPTGIDYDIVRGF